jgi:GTPase SAR1 family protein
LVYDITRKQSFDEIKNYWIGQLKENASKNLSIKNLNTVIALAANKSDMYENEEVEEKIGRQYAKEINAIFKYTSAKNANGIEVV